MDKNILNNGRIGFNCILTENLLFSTFGCSFCCKSKEKLNSESKEIMTTTKKLKMTTISLAGTLKILKDVLRETLWKSNFIIVFPCQFHN
jgi:hypothetical protein